MKPFSPFRLSALLLSLLLLTASLSACGMELLEQTTVGDFTFSIYGKDRVERIEVKRGEERIGSYVQKGLSREMLRSMGDDSYGLLFTDLNFDRTPDIMLTVANTKSGKQSAVYLWDEAAGEYVYPKLLSSLHGVGMIASLGVITAQEYEYTVDPAVGETPEFYTERQSYLLYRWIDGKLTEVYRKDLTYYEESDIYCYAVYERAESGEMDTVRESWINAEKMDPAEYPLDADGYEGYVAN